MSEVAAVPGFEWWGDKTSADAGYAGSPGRAAGSAGSAGSADGSAAATAGSAAAVTSPLFTDTNE